MAASEASSDLRNRLSVLFGEDGFLRFLGTIIEQATPEFARVVMPLLPHHLNAFGIAHGGVICALCDLAFGSAANCQSKTCVETLSMSVEFLRPGAHGPLAAEAKLVHNGKRVVNYDIEIKDAKNIVIAKALACGYVSERPLPG